MPSAKRRTYLAGWRSGSAGPLQGQGHRFKSCTGHQKTPGHRFNTGDFFFCRIFRVSHIACTYAETSQHALAPAALGLPSMHRALYLNVSLQNGSERCAPLAITTTALIINGWKI